MPDLHHIGPDQYLDLDNAEVVTQEQVAQAWDRAYRLLEDRLRDIGPGARLYAVFGLQEGLVDVIEVRSVAAAKR